MICPYGCSNCQFNQTINILSCYFPILGYSFDLAGNVMKCGPLCETCLPFNPQVCYSCSLKSSYVAGKCVPCKD